MIRFEGVTKRFALPNGTAAVALDHLDLEVEKGELVCLIGGSGSGKTTALRLVNRLLEPTSGRISVGGADVRTQDKVTLRRRLGFVVQSGALFPHYTVRENVGLLCRLEGWDPARVDARVEALLESVRLPAAAYAERYPSELSGGQRQRVGVARALALDPPILLLDEPFGALDPITRAELQAEFRALSRQGERTILFVTHDLDEAFGLADRVAILHAGRLLQVGTPEELRTAPADDYVRAFVSKATATSPGAGA